MIERCVTNRTNGGDGLRHDLLQKKVILEGALPSHLSPGALRGNDEKAQRDEMLNMV